ncbi:MAG TPA: hypothetical protein VMH39_09930 [Gemmatimonadaceae bacterium]|nr:hypothetical protein [Gemmatimonadaceae bacterium]
MRRRVPILLAGGALALVLGCRDSTEPSSSAGADALGAVSASFNGSNHRLSTIFVIDPSGGTVSLFGLFKLSFPAHSVCVVGSSYGAGHWDDPCTTITHSLVVHATLEESHGRLWVDFSPGIRFAPSDDPSQWVTISTDIHSQYIRSRGDGSHDGLGTLAILYAPSIGSFPVDEVKTTGDPSLGSVLDFNSGSIWRRIKHFSGYSVLTGETCDPTSGDPYCVSSDVAQSN